MLQTTGRVHLLHQRLLWLLIQVYLCLWSLLLAFHRLPSKLPFHRRRAPLRLRVTMYRQVCPRASDPVPFHNTARYHQMFQMYRSILLPRMSLAILAPPMCHQAILATTTKQAVRRQSLLHLPKFLVKPVRQASQCSLQRRTIPGTRQQIHLQDQQAKDVHHSCASRVKPWRQASRTRRTNLCRQQ